MCSVMRPGPDQAAPPAESGHPPSCRHPDCTASELILAPFRALRLDHTRVDLAAATSPPYDVIDDADVRALERGEQYNVVRLTRPHDPTDPYGRAAATLQAWRRDGVLRRDDQPGLYLVEQERAGHTYRALVGALALRDPSTGVILPHERVMPGPVADRLALLRATRTHLEPILLTTDAGHGAVRMAREACRGMPPLAELVVGSDTHRLWQLTEPVVLARIRTALRPVRALIADGHHRYAAALALRDDAHAAGWGHGGWDYMLAYLVDTGTDPLELDGIHRSLAAVTLDALLDAFRRLDGLAVVSLPRAEAIAALAPAPPAPASGAGTDPHRPRFVLTDGTRWFGVGDPLGRLASMLPPDTPPGWSRLDTALLHEVVLRQLVPVPEEAIGYHHDLEPALRAIATGGCVILLGAPTLTEIIELAAAGVRVPRKTTSFGPKPRTGLLMSPIDPWGTAPVDTPAAD